MNVFFRLAVLLILSTCFVGSAAAQTAKPKSKPPAKAKPGKTNTKTADLKTITFDYDARFDRFDYEDREVRMARVYGLGGFPNVSSNVSVLDFFEVPKDKTELLKKLMKDNIAGIKGVKLGPVEEVKYKHASGVSQTAVWDEPDLGETRVSFYVLEDQGVQFGVQHEVITVEDAKFIAPIVQGILDSIRAKK